METKNDRIKLCYVGSLSHSYDIKCVIDALHRIKASKAQSPQIEFIIMGDGPLRKDFEDYAVKKRVSCTFTGRLAYEDMVAKMCECNIVVNPIVKGSAASIINKVGDYALSGLPVINTQECQEYRNLIDEYHCGINCEVGSSEQVAEAILKLANEIDLRFEMGKNHRRLGVEKFDRRNSYKHIVDLILNQ